MKEKGKREENNKTGDDKKSKKSIIMKTFDWEGRRQRKEKVIRTAIREVNEEKQLARLGSRAF